MKSTIDATSLLERGFSRRQVGRMAAILSGAASLPFYNEAALAQSARRETRMAPDAVRISSNENPLGPCPETLEAIYKVAKLGGRYSPTGESGDLIRTAATMEGLSPEYIAPYAGSSDPLHRAVCAFVSPSKPLVMGDPGYEAGARTAEFFGAKVYRVPLRADYSHDVKKMVVASPDAGVIYICNPNNPSGTLTSKEDIEWVLANKPKGSILLLDEAYIHFSDAVPGSYLVKNDADVIILRTFSKLYGMAGIRAGLALGRPDLLAKLRPFGSGMLPITGMAAAAASLKSKDLVEQRKKINAGIRTDVFAYLDKRGHTYVPSVSNKFMMEVHRPGGEVAEAMATQKVYIGRVWPAWPTHVRVTIGTQEEMDKFKAALEKVMA